MPDLYRRHSVPAGTKLDSRNLNMNPNDQRKTDAQVVAEHAAAALQEGRYTLGRALAILADQAYAAERPTVIDRGNGTFTMNTGGVVPPTYAEEAATQLFHRVEHAAPDVIPGGRCASPGTSPGTVCHGVIFWEPGSVGTDQYPAVPAQWRHMDPELDQDHTPII